MNENIHAYLIGNEVRVEVSQMLVARIYACRKTNDYYAEAVFLGETSMRLLTFLLERSKQSVVPYNDILDDVWDKRGLSSSYKRLHQVMKELKSKLIQIGLPDDFILTVRGKGYCLNQTNITSLSITLCDCNCFKGER